MKGMVNALHSGITVLSFIKIKFYKMCLLLSQVEPVQPAIHPEKHVPVEWSQVPAAHLPQVAVQFGPKYPGGQPVEYKHIYTISRAYLKYWKKSEKTKEHYN